MLASMILRGVSREALHEAVVAAGDGTLQIESAAVAVFAVVLELELSLPLLFLHQFLSLRQGHPLSKPAQLSSKPFDPQFQHTFQDCLHPPSKTCQGGWYF